MANRVQRRLYEILEARYPHGAGTIVQNALLVLILLNVVAVVLESVAAIGDRFARAFQLFELFSVAVFSAEYAARLYSCTQSARQKFRHPVMGRIRFALTPFAIIDLLAILPPFLAALFGIDAGSLRALRLLRVFKLLRYSPATSMLGRVLYNERKSLGGATIIFLVLLLLSSTAAYYAERAAQPKTFGSIPDAMWWAMAALTTVGYGDVTPITPLGRTIGGFVALLGIAVVALPVGIVASGFVEESKRRDFVVTWNLLASVPFFQELMAPQVADLVRTLRPRFVQPGDVIVHKNDHGDSMFIIASGDVEVDIGADREPIALGPGQFFGEMALLNPMPRVATVRAASECKLLELHRNEFNELMAQHPHLKERISRIAAERYASNVDAAPRPE